MRTELIKGLPGPDNILRKQFSNGVTVLVHENPWSSSAAICGSIYAGSCLETPDTLGLTSFVSASLSAGSLSGNFRNVSEYLESIGSTLSFTSDPHAIRFKGNCLNEDLENFLKTLKGILEEPAFPEHDFEILQQQALRGFVPDEDTPDDKAHELFQEFLWGNDHPYGRPKLGDNEIILNITQDDMVNFHRRFFGPKKFILSLVGGFRGPEIMDKCEEIFGNWVKTQEETDEDALFPQVERHEECTHVHMDYPSKKEVSLIIGTFGPGFSDHDNLSARLGNNILGEFGNMGRIGRVIRDVHGLAYDISSVLDSRKKGGSWYVEAEINPVNLEKTVEMILEELAHFAEESVSTQELEDTKSWWISSLPLAFVPNEGKAAMIHDLEFYQRDLDYFLHLPEQVDDITPEMILETAQKWIDPKRVVITTTGPRSDSVQ